MSQLRRTNSKRSVRVARIALTSAALVALVLLNGAAVGDDRDFFKAPDASPYVFMLLDTSGSMTWDFNDDRVEASGDDPNSKLYQAKSALFEVVQGVGDDVRLGFAHFRSSDPEYRNKRWLYRRAD